MAITSSRRRSARTSTKPSTASTKPLNTPRRPTHNSISTVSSASSVGSREGCQELFDRNLSNVSRPNTPLNLFDMVSDSLVEGKSLLIRVTLKEVLDITIVAYTVPKGEIRKAGHFDGAPKRTKKNCRLQIVSTSSLNPQDLPNQLIENRTDEVDPPARAQRYQIPVKSSQMTITKPSLWRR